MSKKRQVVGARQLRERPFAGENAASVTRQMTQPKGHEALLRWFLEGFRAEMPEAMHSAGVWRSRKAPIDARGAPLEDVPTEHQGGSLLGSPRLADGFRALIEDSPFATEVAEYEGHRDTVGHYRTPIRAALAELAGRVAGREDHPYPFMARMLYRTAFMDGDWDAACASLGIIEPVRRVYVEEALYRLWRRFRIEPPARLIRDPQVQAIAQEGSAA